jgi:hypothetical protein
MRWGFFLTALSLLLVVACVTAPLIVPLPTHAAPAAPER